MHRWAVNGFFLDPALCYSSAGRKSTRYLRVLCQRKNRIYKYRFFRSTKEDLQSIACQNQLWGCSIRVLPFQARFDQPPLPLPPIVSIQLPLTPFFRTDGHFEWKLGYASVRHFLDFDQIPIFDLFCTSTALVRLPFSDLCTSTFLQIWIYYWSISTVLVEVEFSWHKLRRFRWK